MSRDGLPRAYLRIDPNIDQVYPELRGTFVGLMCAAHRQPSRGRFRDRRLVEALCGRAYVRRAYERGDIVDLPDGRAYVEGWDEWQEGDHTVAERMRRMRDRRNRKRATRPPSHDRNDVTTDAVSKGLSGTREGDSDSGFPPPPTSGGRRSDGTNPRAQSSSPRQNGHAPRDLGTSVRQERQEQKQGGVEALGAIIARTSP